MMKKKGKKLHLAVETIRRLNPATLGEAVGGINGPFYKDSSPCYRDPDFASCKIGCSTVCQ
jgi:hypothetical protein